MAGLVAVPLGLAAGVVGAAPAFASCQPPDHFDTCSQALQPYVVAANAALASAEQTVQSDLAAAGASAQGGVATVSNLAGGAGGTGAGAEATALQLAASAVGTATMLESQLSDQVSQLKGQALLAAQGALVTATAAVAAVQSLLSQLQSVATGAVSTVDSAVVATAAQAQQAAQALLSQVQAMLPVDTAAEPTADYLPSPVSVALDSTFDTATLPQTDALSAGTPTVTHPTLTANQDTATTTVPLGLPLAPVDPGSTLSLPSGAANDGLTAANDSVTSRNPTVNSAFNGITENGYPADSNAAAGPNDVVETINEEIQQFSKTGGAGFHTSNQTWFGTGSDNTYDAHVLFESNAGRYLAVADDADHSLVMTVSRTASMTGPTCRYKIPVSTTFADYPQIGYNANWIYLTYTIYKSHTDETETDAQILELPRTQVEGCQNLGGFVYKGVQDPGTGGFFSGDQLAYDITPAAEYDSITTAGTFVSAYAGGGKHMSVFTISTDGQHMSARRISTPSYSPPSAAPQPTTSGKLDMDAPHTGQAINSYSYGLYTTINTEVSFNGKSSAGVMVLRLDNEPGNESVLQSTTFGYPGDWFGFPAVGPDSSGNAAIVYTLSGSTMAPAVHYAAWALGGGLGPDRYLAGGAANTHYTEAVAQTGSGSGIYRWGDYSSVVQDPTDYTKLWICSTNGTASNDRYGTSVAEITL